jgi:hypothetical protein
MNRAPHSRGSLEDRLRISDGYDRRTSGDGNYGRAAVVIAPVSANSLSENGNFSEYGRRLSAISGPGNGDREPGDNSSAGKGRISGPVWRR